MNYAQIKEYDIANGPGVRVSLFVSGCRNKCPGCFNPETWDFQYGKTYTLETQDRILRSLLPDYIEGLTLLGGEPFEPENQAVLVGLLRKVRQIYPNKSVWCYTGYTYERDLLRGGEQHTSFTDEMLSLIDVLVDGRFLLAEKDITLLYRGSRNQRILELHPDRDASDREASGRQISGGEDSDSGIRQEDKPQGAPSVYDPGQARDALPKITEIARGDSLWKK